MDHERVSTRGRGGRALNTGFTDLPWLGFLAPGPILPGSNCRDDVVRSVYPDQPDRQASVQWPGRTPDRMSRVIDTDVRLWQARSVRG